jgi:hypothetical protein
MTLPERWLDMSLDALWNYLNDPERHPVPRSTIDADNYRDKDYKKLIDVIVANLRGPK